MRIDRLSNNKRTPGFGVLLFASRFQLRAFLSMGGHRNRTHRFCSFSSSTAHPEQCSVHIVWSIEHIQSTGWDSCPYFLLWQGLRGSNPRLWFWRPAYYHCTKPPYKENQSYLVSLCMVCFLHFLQNFFISRRSFNFFLFFVE